MSISIQKAFGICVRKFHMDIGLSQEKFALKIDMDRTYYASAIENYIYFYNTHRYQKRLNCMTPCEYYFATAASRKSPPAVQQGEMKESIQLTYSFCFFVCLLDRGRITLETGGCFSCFREWQTTRSCR